MSTKNVLHFTLPKFSPSGDGHVFPQHCRNLLQLLDPLLPLPETPIGQGAETRTTGLPATSYTAAQNSQHAMGPHGFAQQGWTLKQQIQQRTWKPTWLSVQVKVLTGVTRLAAPECCFGSGWFSGLTGSHRSQRSGCEVTLQVQRAVRVSDSSSHHTRDNSSTSWNKQQQKHWMDGFQTYRWT